MLFVEQRVRILPRSQSWYESPQNAFACRSRGAFVYIPICLLCLCLSLCLSLSRALSLCLPFVIVPTGAWSGTDVASTHSDGKAWFSVPGPLEAKFPLPDNQTADHAVQTLRALAEKHVAGAKKPWFVAVGFHKVRVR